MKMKQGSRWCRGEVMGLRVLKRLEVLVSWGHHKAGDQNFYFILYYIFIFLAISVYLFIVAPVDVIESGSIIGFKMDSLMS